MLIRLCANMHLSADLLKVLLVFLAVGVFFVVLFSAQLFLIYLIERAHLTRRLRQQSKLNKGCRSQRPPAGDQAG
jgi:hypothetical protein